MEQKNKIKPQNTLTNNKKATQKYFNKISEHQR